MQMGLRNDPRRGQNTLHGSYQIWLPVLYCKYDARAHKLFQSKYIKIQEPRLSLSLSSGEDFKFNASLVQSKAPLP